MGIAEPVPEVAAADCRVVVGDDRLRAWVAPLTGFGTAEVSVRLVEDRMKEVGLALSAERRGELLARVERGRLRVEGQVVVAEGVAAVEGTAGGLERIEELKREEGECDHYHRSRVRTVKAGQRVARVVAATPGCDGRDVFGEVVPCAAVAAFRVEAGENVRVEGDVVVAACDGSLKIDGGKVWVEDFLHIKGNVDFSTGNVEFGGDVVVDGGVGDLFEVKARNLTVRKAIEAAHVVAAKHLHADGGIVGKEKAVVEAGEELAVRFIAGARVRCGGPVTVLSEVSNSDVACAGKLSLAKGTVLHSMVSAGGGVAARALGSAAELRTVVEVGVSEPEVRRVARAWEELHERQVEHARMRRLIEAALNMPGRLSEGQRVKAKAVLAHLGEQDAEDARKREGLSAEWGRVVAGSRAEVEVQDRVWPGVVLRFPGVEAEVREAVKGPVRFVARQVQSGWKVVGILTSRHGELVMESRELETAGMVRRLGELVGEPGRSASA